jgi:hypothetical protein
MKNTSFILLGPLFLLISGCGFKSEPIALEDIAEPHEKNTSFQRKEPSYEITANHLQFDLTTEPYTIELKTPKPIEEKNKSMTFEINTELKKVLNANAYVIGSIEEKEPDFEKIEHLYFFHKITQSEDLVVKYFYFELPEDINTSERYVSFKSSGCQCHPGTTEKHIQFRVFLLRQDNNNLTINSIINVELKEKHQHH